MDKIKRTYYTNGVNEIRIFPWEQVPNGWHKGRVKSTSTTLGKAWVNDGKKEFFVYRNAIPTGFSVGRLAFSDTHINDSRGSFKSKKYHWYTNGEINISIPEGSAVPCDFIAGRSVDDVTRHHQSISAKNRNISEENEKLRMQHSYLTKKNNKSFNTSSDEEKYYKYLLSLYSESDIVRSYKSEEYPFNCDFYIKSENRYIELNKHWTHGGMPYIKGDPTCDEKLRIWEEKSKFSKFYKNAIITWTIRDVLKVKTSIKNKLNYTVIY